MKFAHFKPAVKALTFCAAEYVICVHLMHRPLFLNCIRMDTASLMSIVLMF
jgi:hypothetical protein